MKYVIFLEVPYLKTSIFELVSIDVDKCLKVVVVWYDTIIINKWLYSQKKRCFFVALFFRQGKLLIKCAAQCTVNSSYICKSVITTIVTNIFFGLQDAIVVVYEQQKKKKQIKNNWKIPLQSQFASQSSCTSLLLFSFQGKFSMGCYFSKIKKIQQKYWKKITENLKKNILFMIQTHTICWKGR